VWGPELEALWYRSLCKSRTAGEIMGCVLVLEHYLQRPWMEPPYNKLLAALPAPHFAVRTATLSAASLRLFCIDRIIDYRKVASVSRSKRTSEGGETGGRAGTGGTGSRASGRKPRVSYEDPGSSGEGEEVNISYEEDNSGSRPRRAASQVSLTYS